MIAADLFAGGGMASVGMRQAGCSLAWAVECDEPTADVYAANHGPHVLCRRVQDVDPCALERPDILWASPVCKEFSVANAGGTEGTEDITAAEAVCRFLSVLRPRAFALENVAGYRRSRSLSLIRRTLDELGYWSSETLVNAADYGVPQTRRRLILRAVLHGLLPPLPTPVQWRGWYDAIADLIDGLPPSAFAIWQLARLPDELKPFLMQVAGEASDYKEQAEPAPTITSAHGAGKYRAFLVEGSAAGEDNKFNMPVREASEPAFTMRARQNNPRAFLVDGQQSCPSRPYLVNGTDSERSLTIRTEAEPSFTIPASVHKGSPRAWLEQGRVVSMTPRALARFQSIPDDYVLPASNKLACSVIGNACPPLLVQAVVQTLMEAIQ